MTIENVLDLGARLCLGAFRMLGRTRTDYPKHLHTDDPAELQKHVILAAVRRDGTLEWIENTPANRRLLWALTAVVCVLALGLICVAIAVLQVLV